ncbi:MAG TPA: FtsX-like permease family protein, partial [Xanthomonadales bacterium]|nr:FtsX-like permease family protein [Xanthomonadales bacterium]
TRFGQWLDQPTRIILRNIARGPARALFTIGGVSCSVALLVLALQWEDALDYMAQSYFFEAQRQDVMVGLTEPQATDIIHDFGHLPGVLAVEPTRIVGANFAAGPLLHRGSIVGLTSGAELQPIYDEARGVRLPVPEEGLVLAQALAEKLDLHVGDQVWVSIREGKRPEALLTVVGLVETYIGVPAYMHLDALNVLLQERPRASFLNLLTDESKVTELYRELKDLPSVSAVMLRRTAINSFEKAVAENMMVFITLFSLFAGALGFGVAYNAARIALSERGRDLATLRVLGFSRGETSYILLGEVLLLIILALPLGCLLGYLLSVIMASLFDTELFRVPLVVENSTYGNACVIALIATAVSIMIVRRRVDRLRLLDVLKTRE